MARWNPKRLTRELEGWVGREDNRHRLLAKVRADLSVALGTPPGDPGRLRVVVQQLQWHALWQRQAGMLAVLRGDAAGWTSVGAAGRCQAAAMKAKLRLLQTGEESLLAIGESMAALAICDAINFGDLAEADAVAGALGEYLAGVRPPGNGLRSPEQFPEFAVALHRAGHAGPALMGFPAGDGVYGAVSKAWAAGGEPLAAALASACDYHCVRISYERDGEFHFYPLYPSEIVAIQRVRAMAGLATPAVDHPLLAGSLAAPPAVVTPEPDQLLADAFDWLARSVQIVLTSPRRRPRK